MTASVPTREELIAQFRNLPGFARWKETEVSWTTPIFFTCEKFLLRVTVRRNGLEGILYELTLHYANQQYMETLYSYSLVEISRWAADWAEKIPMYGVHLE